MRISYIRISRSLFLNILRNLWDSGKRPVYCGFKVTYRCNFRCKMCPFWKMNKFKDLPTEKEIELLKLLKKARINFVMFEGGEPLLRDDISDILKFAFDNGFMTSMITNGWLLAEKINEISPYLDFLFVSVDVIGKTHDEQRGVKGSFERAVKGIKASRRKVFTIINATLTKDNLKDIFKLIELARKLKICISIEVAHDYSTADKLSPKKLRDYKQTIDKIIKMKERGYKILNSKTYFEVLKGDRDWECRPWKTINIDPYGNLILPCYIHYGDGFKVPLFKNSDIIGIIRNFDWNQVKGCKKCNLHCYIEPSMLKLSNSEMLSNWILTPVRDAFFKPKDIIYPSK